MRLSIVIPAYNEERRIENTLSLVRDFLEKQNYPGEVILVDDGSDDDTVGKAERSELAKNGKLKILKNELNMGKGFSVKKGVLASSGDHVLFSDADLSTPIEEVDKLFREMKAGYDIVIGSRDSADSNVRTHQPWYRERMGKIFNFLVRMILMRDFSDTQCGFKLFRGDAARALADELKIDGFCFDVEMLYLAKKKGYKIKEKGVIWENSLQSKVKVFSSSAQMFVDLFRIKLIHG